MAASTAARTEHFALHVERLNPSVNKQSVAPSTESPLAAMAKIGGVWVGAVLPKRCAKRAVTRNTIKRQVFSVGQDFEPLMADVALVIRLRAGFDKSRFASASSAPLKAAIRLELQQLFSLGLAGVKAAPEPGVP